MFVMESVTHLEVLKAWVIMYIYGFVPSGSCLSLTTTDICPPSHCSMGPLTLAWCGRKRPWVFLNTARWVRHFWSGHDLGPMWVRHFWSGHDLGPMWVRHFWSGHNLGPMWVRHFRSGHDLGPMWVRHFWSGNDLRSMWLEAAVSVSQYNKVNKVLLLW